MRIFQDHPRLLEIIYVMTRRSLLPFRPWLKPGSWIETRSKQIEHIELETTEDFFDVFVEGCMFRPTSESRSAP